MMFNMHPHKWGNGDNCRQRFWLKSQSPAYGLISLIFIENVHLAVNKHLDRDESPECPVILVNF